MTSANRQDSALQIGRIPDDELDCDMCGDVLGKKNLATLPCKCRWCAACLRRRFEAALRNEGLDPPKCCMKTTIPMTRQITRQLPKKLLRSLEAVRIERQTRDRTYCHKPTCSTFIKPQSIHNGQAFCQRKGCGANTCVKCKTGWHYGPCQRTDLDKLLDLADEKKWMPCPDCRQLVERTAGCPFMICICSCEYCYNCGKKFESEGEVCQCEPEEDDQDLGSEDEEDFSEDEDISLDDPEDVLDEFLSNDGSDESDDDEDDSEDGDDSEDEELREDLFFDLYGQGSSEDDDTGDEDTENSKGDDKKSQVRDSDEV